MGDAASSQLRHPGRSFSLTEGGPFYRLLTRLRLRTPTSMMRAWSLGFLAWIPLMLGESVRLLLGRPIDPMLLDHSVHARLLFTLPVLLSSEILLENTARSAMASLYRGHYCDRALIDRIAERAERLRDSWVAELVILGIAILGGQLVLWRVFGASGLFHGGEPVGFWSFPRVWYALVALPLLQFVMFRWMWRWLIWTYVLLRIARLPLTVLATHADYACGLSALARPMTAFSAFVLAIAAILSGAWATKLIEHRATLQSLLPMAVMFLVIALAVAIGPLLPLCGHLFRGRRRTLVQYGDFMRRYTLDFHHKWIQTPPRERQDPLGTSDIQSLADLGNSYQVAAKTRVFVFSSRNVLSVWFAGILPMLPLLLNALTVDVVFKHIVRTVLGGLPL